MTVEEYFGTLLQSVTDAHKKHLKTDRYGNHKALNDFYDDMPELVDDLIEHYQGTHEKVKDYKNVIDADGKDAIEYLEELLDFTRKGQDELFEDDKALSSDVDAIVGAIASALYKLKYLHKGKEDSNDDTNESHRGMKSLADYINESLAEDSQSVKAPRLNTKAWDYNGDAWTIKMIANADSREINKLIDMYDKDNSDVSLQEELDAANKDDLEGLICVGCESTSVRGMRAAFIWGYGGVCYENK